MVNLDRCAGTYNALDDLSSRAYIPNKTEGLNLYVFNMVAGIKQSRTLTKASLMQMWM